MPSLPNTSLVPYLISDAIPIAVVCYMFVMSMGKLFAKKHKYRTDATQEFYAVGIMSVASSFFPVYPVGASLSRSSVCEMSGANTQLYTVFSSTLLLTVILSLGPFLEPLPMCILACIVIVSLKSLFLQFKELPRYWRISKYDFAIWLTACVTTIITDVTKGLIISLTFALFTVVLREQWPRFAAAHVDTIPPQHVPEGVTVLKFESPLHLQM
nr:Sulphate transporter domain containing protein [Haemonchus contortus]